MNTRTFPIDEILSVSTGRLVADRHVDALYDLIGHIANNDGVSTIGLTVLADPTKKFLLEQFPELDRTETDSLDRGLDAARKRGNGRREIENILCLSACRLWTDRMTELVGKHEFAVSQMQNSRPRGLQDDIDHMIQLNPNADVMVINLPSKSQ